MDRPDLPRHDQRVCQDSCLPATLAPLTIKVSSQLEMHEQVIGLRESQTWVLTKIPIVRLYKTILHVLPLFTPFIGQVFNKTYHLWNEEDGIVLEYVKGLCPKIM